MENLFDALTDALDARRDVLEPAFIAVPNRAMERAIEVHLATHVGIAGNLRFERIDGLTSRLLAQRAARRTDDASEDARELPAESGRWEALFLALLHDERALGATQLAPVVHWLGSGLGSEVQGREGRVVSLAARLAELMRSYDERRPELVRAWAGGTPAPRTLGLETDAFRFHEGWQRAMVLAARQRGPAPFATELLDRLAAEPRLTRTEPLHVIGLSHATRTTMRALRTLDQQRPLAVYVLDPCREFWEDVETGAEEARRMRRSSAGAVPAPSAASEAGSGADAHGAESAILSAWGKAGREHLAELNELSQWSAEERFDDEPAPHEESDLLEIQRSILERRAVKPSPAPDGTVLLLPCPSVRRELEVVATEIWSRVAKGARFSEVAVLLHEGEKERYLPLLPSVFSEARDLPWSAVDVPFVWRSRIAAGALRLIALTTTEVTRSRVLDLLFHPSVHAQMPEARASAWSAMLDRLGFFHGLGAPVGSRRGGSGAEVRGEVRGDRGGALAQALDRLALGAVTSGERSGVSTPIGGLFPEEIDAAADESGGLYRILRSLAADLVFAREEQRSLLEWAHFFRAMLEAYLVPDGAKDEADLLRVRAAILSLERRHVEGTRYGVKVAESIFTRELTGLRAEVGAPTISGVTVSTLVPMRTIPFRHVFVLGLGEGRFAGAREERGLDLTRGARLFGDVEDGERDRYTFLETLLSARESLAISWVARDEATGDPITAASVVSELTSAAPGRLARIEPPLRRHEDEARGVVAQGALYGVAEERKARRLGDLERDELTSEGAQGASMAMSAFAGLVRGDDPRRALLTWDALADVAHVTSEATASSSSSSSSSSGSGSGSSRSGPAPSRLGPAPSRLGPAPSRLSPARPGPSPSSSKITAPELRIRLEQLRQFLERPMQTAAEHALGQGRGPSRDRIDEPPVVLGRAQEARLLRDAVRRALRSSERAPRSLLEERAQRERARGTLPEGALGARAIDRLEEGLRGLLAAVREVLGPAADGPILAARFGPGRTLTEHEELPLSILELGRSVRAERVFVQGESHGWLADHGRAWVIVDPLGHHGKTDRRSVTRTQQQLLRAFVDHAALACSFDAHDAGGAIGRTVHVACPTGASTARFRPISEAAARGWLRALADELAVGYAAFLPGEVVLGQADRIRRHDSGLVEALERALDKARAKDERLLELHGPVRDARERPSPAPSELLRVVGRRFGPFFEYVEFDEPHRKAR